MTALRSLWLKLHRWLALGLGWVLVLAGLTGALLVVAQPLDRQLHAELFTAPAPSGAATPVPTALAPLYARLQQEFGDKATVSFRLPQQPGDSLWATVRGNWNGTLYLNPWTGQEQGRRGATEGFANTLFKLHSSLLLESTGKAILAWVALAYLVLLLTGLVLWWPRHWAQAWRVELRKNLARSLFDLHRVGGAALGLLLAVSVATGAYMAWRPLGGAINWFSGASTVEPPQLPQLEAAPGPLPSVDALRETAQRALPEGQLRMLQLPAAPTKPVRVRFLVPGEPHPNGVSSVWMDPRTGQVLAVRRWNEVDPGAAAVAFIYPLHTGELGGWPLETAVALGGLVLAGLGISGLWLWWHRRQARQRAHAHAQTQRMRVQN
ncbi:MAG: PepSY domain-containing protein [Comamonas sp.]